MTNESEPMLSDKPIARLSDSIASPSAADGWRDISTAPEGEKGEILAYKPRVGIVIVRWLDVADHPDRDVTGWYESWNHDYVDGLTHWMPLPAQPGAPAASPAPAQPAPHAAGWKLVPPQMTTDQDRAAFMAMSESVSTADRHAIYSAAVAAAPAQPAEDQSDYRAMFLDAARTLASIDEALGITDDGCADPDRTLDAIRELKDAQPAEPPAQAGAPKLWCETCEGSGLIHQESQAGCHVVGDYACPDCDGKGWYVSGRRALTVAEPPAAPAQPLTDEQLGRIAHEAFDAYWHEDCKGNEWEAWADAAAAVRAALASPPVCRSQQSHQCPKSQRHQLRGQLSGQSRAI
jgi:hypothetical protein